MTSLHDPDALERELDAALEEDAAPRASDAPAPVPAAGEVTPRRRSPRTLALSVVAGVVALGLCVAVVLLGLGLHRAHALETAHAQALQAGKDGAVAVSSYDYRHLDQDFGKVTASSTPTFRASFNDTSAKLRTVLGQYKATATSTVVAAGLTSGDTHRAVVLVFLNQVATHTDPATNKVSDPTKDQNRVQVTLKHSGNRWLIDGVNIL